MLFKNWGIQGRFLLIVSLMVLLLIGVVGTGIGLISNKFQVVQEQRFIKELQAQQATQESLLAKGLDQKGEALASMLAQDGASLIVGYDFDTLASMAKNGAQNQDVAFVVFLGTDGKALTQKPAQIGKSVKVMEKDVIFGGEKIATVRLGIDTSSVTKASRDVSERLSRTIMQAKEDHKSALHSIIMQGGATGVLGVVVLCLVVSWALRSLIIKPLKTIAEGLDHEATRLATAADQVSSASEALAEGSSQQAAGIEETSSSLEEMGSMTRQNAENAQEAATIVQDSVDKFSAAGKSMKRLTTSMQEISGASEETQKIIKTIDEIAFQTNLLSLNAAVEAARAGEAGAGFAVVADEVRNLAMRAAEAAKNTAAIIEETVKKIQEGSHLVEETNSSFDEARRDSERVAALVSEIAVASGEQSQGIDQVSTAVSQIDQVVQQNAANAEQSAAAAKELKTQEQRMSELVERLVTLLKGGRDQLEEDQDGSENFEHGEVTRQAKSASREGNGTSALLRRRHNPASRLHAGDDHALISMDQDDSDLF